MLSVHKNKTTTKFDLLEEREEGIKPVHYRKQSKPPPVSKAFRLLQNMIFQREGKTKT